MLPQNAAHWHLMLNHFAVVGTVAGAILLVVLWGRGSDDLRRLSLWWFVVVALIGIPVYLTGEPAEELVEGLRNVSHDRIEQHEELAMWAFGLLSFTGLVALIGIGVRYTGRQLHALFFPGLTVLAVLTAGMMMYTAALGGHIHHPETHPGFTPPEEHDEETGALRHWEKRLQSRGTGRSTITGSVRRSGCLWTRHGLQETSKNKKVRFYSFVHFSTSEVQL